MIKIAESKTIKEIYTIIKGFDDKFPRSISSRIGDLYKYSEKLAKYSIFLIAKDDNIIVGFAALYANDMLNRKAYLAQIAVADGYQGKGVGSLLIKSCEKISFEQGMLKIKLEVDNINLGAIEFYKKTGYQLDSRNEVSCFMSKNLQSMQD